jgi:hypothetical protein
MRCFRFQQYRSRDLTNLVRRHQHHTRVAAFSPAFHNQGVSSRRTLFTQVPDVLLPPLIFGSLFVGLWTWKCCMMVLFQNKIIYMPGLPPNARWEKISDYASQCHGITWREERTNSSDGTEIALCVADIESRTSPALPPAVPIYILYFQGKMGIFWFLCSCRCHRTYGSEAPIYSAGPTAFA